MILPSSHGAYEALLPRIQKAALSLSADCAIIGDLEGFPLTAIRAGGGSSRQHMHIDAGIHGDEPASSLGLLEWLERDAATWLGSIRFTILPCLNPFGFSRDTRGSRDSQDLNRQFDDPAAPLTRILSRALDGERFDLVMDLHEDRDFAAFYLYELRPHPPYLGEKLAAVAETCVPLSHGQSVGSLWTQHGLLRPEIEERTLAARRGWPIAFYHFENYSRHVVTVETPGRLSLPDRIGLQRRLLNSACSFLSSGPEALS